MIKPKRLQQGDTIALIRPASRLTEALYENSKNILRQLGFCVVEYPYKKTVDLFFAASDADRAKELHWAMTEPGIRGVFACRGGYGCQRSLSLISKSMLKKWKPKLVLGYSDITYLHQWLQNQMGLASFHGPLVGSLQKKQIKALMNELINLPMKPSIQKWSEIKNRGSARKASGKLVGGNLSLIQVAGMAALPKEPIVLVLEDVNENFYRIDRMVWTLIDAGYSKYVRAVIVGNLEGCGADDSKIFKFENIIGSLKKLTRGPIWTAAHFGHGLNGAKKLQRLLPVGCKVELSGKNFRILEAVVR